MDDSWSCKACTYINASSSVVCEMCGTKRPKRPQETNHGEYSAVDPAEEERNRRREKLAEQAENRQAAERVRGIGDPSKLQASSQKQDAPRPAAAATSEPAPEETVSKESPAELPIVGDGNLAKDEDEEPLPEGCMTPSTALAMKLSKDASEARVEDPRFGKALTGKQLRQMNIHFEAQEPCSDTCAQKALNNLAQMSLFSIEDLGQAEVAPTSNAWGMELNVPSSPSAMPTGFFDVEAVKRAATQKGLEVVDIEPKADHRESALPIYLEGCGGDADDSTVVDGSWLKGFLVYDSRPGHARHFYAIVVRPGRQFAVLNSLEEDFGAQNRLLTEEELWSMHEHYANDFRSWVFRWYPVVSRSKAVSALQAILHDDDPQWTIADERAERVIKACQWQVPLAAKRLLKDDVELVLHRFRASLLVIPRSLAQAELEAATGDPQQAAERLSEILRQQAASQVPEDAVARQALNAAAWSVDGAVNLLELLGKDDPEELQVLSAILQRVDWQFHHAVKVRKVLERFSKKSGEESTEEGIELDADAAANLLEVCAWNADEAIRVAVLQKGYKQCPVGILRTVLHRNDGDSSAASEMLKDFRDRVCAHVQKCAKSSSRGKANFSEEDVAALTSAAIDFGHWSPAPVLDHARRLVDFAISTKVVCTLSGQPFVPAEHIIWALRECGESVASPEVAARMLCYGEDAEEAITLLRRGEGKRDSKGQVPPAGKGGGKAKAKPRPKPKPQYDDDSCSLM